MKKILAFFGSLFLIIASVATVVACGPTIESDVLLLLPGDVMSSSSGVNRAYRKIVEEFNNSEEMKDSNVKVKVTWEADNAVQRRSLSGEQLPDLYVSYADNVSSYVLDPAIKDLTRDMELTATGSTSKTDDFKNQFWSENFYNEGVIDDKLHVLPMNKSFDLSFVNLKVFLELVNFVNPSWATSIGSGLVSEQRPYTDKKTELFLPLKENEQLNISESLRTNLETIANAPVKSTAIHNFFKLNQNVLDLANLYSQLYRNNLNDNLVKEKYIGQNGDLRKIYSIGLESPANRIFMEYADAMNQSRINPMDENTNNFFYAIRDLNPWLNRMNVVLDDVSSPTFQAITKFFNDLRSYSSGTGNNANDRWSGSMIPGRVGGSRTYAGVYFVQGTMLFASGTSAATWDYQPNQPTSGVEDQYELDKDIFVTATSTATGNNFNFLQQGAGLAGFKSVGKNATEKEAVTTKFLQYLLKAKNQNRFAVMAGYIPSTKDALDMYRYYKDGSFDNETGKWQDGVTQPSNVDDFEQIHQPNGDVILQKDPLITDFLNNFALNKDVQMNVVTTNPNPLGSVIRLSAERALRSYIFNIQYDFQDLLSQSRDRRTLGFQLRSSLPGNYGDSRIIFR